MPKVRLILSTGRTSTQSLFVTLREALPNAVVQHEGLGSGYFSRRAFRNPAEQKILLKEKPRIAQKIDEIESVLSAGQDYIDVGWPNYAWFDYFSDRFGDDFVFAQLVRNPFRTAASLMTHGFFRHPEQRGNAFEQHALVHTSDPRVYYKQFRDIGADFSSFEKNLYHWLELNRLGRDLIHLSGFVGCFRFEDLHSDNSPSLNQFLSILCEAELALAEPKSIDRFNKALRSELGAINKDLKEAVCQLAAEMGYGSSELEEACQVDRLAAIYTKRRM